MDTSSAIEVGDLLDNCLVATTVSRRPDLLGSHEDILQNVRFIVCTSGHTPLLPGVERKIVHAVRYFSAVDRIILCPPLFRHVWSSGLWSRHMPKREMNGCEWTVVTLWRRSMSREAKINEMLAGHASSGDFAYGFRIFGRDGKTKAWGARRKDRAEPVLQRKGYRVGKMARMVQPLNTSRAPRQ
ncbi:hypothetical protein RRG08_004766 [Elysia crispata]|uniref:Uncharacterized protein n=1 Tax=Elysia crispata TaxID=231223 RepID=A0AAE1AJV2_9GAST|nr:hypothetical protein RRG08_004766 [Elysia crispata]